jgi:hypothetical protein
MASTPQIDAVRNSFYDAQHTMKRASIPTPTPQLCIVSLLTCSFLSGAAGLIYQVAWAKALALLLGYTAYAVATALVVFMRGLS